jgi:amino-acid N-acetyltransferase
MRSFQIRKATSEDLRAIQQLLQSHNLVSDDVGQHLEHFLVAEIDGAIAGTIGLEFYETTALLRSAAVVPTYQHQGIGEKLLASIDGYAREHGVDEIVLLTSTAEEYFSRKGFTTIKRDELAGRVLTSTQFNGACPSTAVSMRKKL